MSDHEYCHPRELDPKVTEPIALTDAAVAKVAELIAAAGAEEALALRVAVKPGGCSGFNYDMYFDSEIVDEDIVSAFGEIKVVVDPASAELAHGCDPRLHRRPPGRGFSHHEPQRLSYLRVRQLL